MGFELQTSEKNVVGDWEIKVQIKSYTKLIKIEVKKYVLPKFQVTVKLPSYITKMMETLSVKVCAK